MTGTGSCLTTPYFIVRLQGEKVLPLRRYAATPSRKSGLQEGAAPMYQGEVAAG